MSDGPIDPAVRLRKLRADLKIKTGDLKRFARLLRQAQDYEQPRKVAKAQADFDKVKQTIDDVKRAIQELEGVQA